MEKKKELGGIVQQYDSPYVTQEGMQKNLSTFDMGGIVHQYNSVNFPTYGKIGANSSSLIEGDMFSGDRMFKNGGSIDKDERDRDMEEIKSIIEDYRDCMKRRAMCDATKKYAQSCVYKEKAMDCKRKAAKMISKYREKYGRTESSSWMEFSKGGNIQKQEDVVDAAKEKLNESFVLPIELAVYVPSTKGADETIEQNEFRNRVLETEKYLSELFGGYSKVDIDGGYVSETKGLINEDVAKVVAFSQDENFLSNKLPRLIKRITMWCDEWTQESIGFEIEGDLFYIDKNFQYDKQMFFDGGQAVMLYNVVDEDGNFLLMGVTENRIIEYANLVFYYDMKDSGESDINTLQDAIQAFESLDYMVEETKSNRMPSNFKDGGSIAEGNYKMVLSQAKEIHHHILELQNVLKKEKEIEAWVVGKIETISADLSTVTHYLEGKSEYEDGGSIDKLLEKKNEIEDSRDKKMSKFGNKISPKLTKKGINFSKKVRGTGELLGKAYLGARGVKADGGEMAIGGLVGKKLKRTISKGTKYGKLAVKKAKPKAKKIVRKLKIGFDALAKKVAKSYEGKAVDPKYQKQYGKRYSKEEAQEVGNKVAAKVKRMKGM
jgi:hypothetical protein